MLFNSFTFLLFFTILFTLYWFVFNRNAKIQNQLLLVSSYVFYGWWDWRFLSLIVASTFVDFIAAKKIHGTDSAKKKKFYLSISLVFNLGLLGFFKYFNFFIKSFSELLKSVGVGVDDYSLYIILPVGISFYTFQTMSYTIDVYRKRMSPTNDFVSFAAFVSFFPQLVAGPIERASNLLPQILNRRNFNYQQAVEGSRLVLWGLFKKVVVADSLAVHVNTIFANYESLNGLSLLLGALFFAFQIYCDFSGYSDIAIGISKILGFELMSNFKFPYFSRNIAEFWRRWHISLSTWFRDYLYIPLGGSKGGKFLSLRNVFAIFIVSGFWHGANWTFILWGLIHALLYIPSFLLDTNRLYTDTTIGLEKKLTPRELLGLVATFSGVVISWIFFRSETVTDSFSYISRLFTTSWNLEQNFHNGLPFIMVLLVIEWFLRGNERVIVMPKSRVIRYGIYTVVSLTVIVFSGLKSAQDFIYFQF